MNRSDTERVRTVLHGMGFTETDKEEEATILGVIACSVRQKGIDKVYSRILKWNEMKQNHNCITFVSGCILPADRERFVKLFDLVFTMNELPDLPDMIHQYGVFIPTKMPSNKSRCSHWLVYLLIETSIHRQTWTVFGSSIPIISLILKRLSRFRTAVISSAPTALCLTPVAAKYQENLKISSMS